MKILKIFQDVSKVTEKQLQWSPTLSKVVDLVKCNYIASVFV